jgi:hypothetical protein
MAQALARWRHPVAPSEALDVLYRAMRPMLYRRIRMAIKIHQQFACILLLLLIRCCART